MGGHAALCLKGLAEVKDAVTCAGRQDVKGRESKLHRQQIAT